MAPRGGEPYKMHTYALCMADTVFFQGVRIKAEHLLVCAALSLLNDDACMQMEGCEVHGWLCRFWKILSNISNKV